MAALERPFDFVITSLDGNNFTMVSGSYDDLMNKIEAKDFIYGIVCNDFGESGRQVVTEFLFSIQDNDGVKFFIIAPHVWEGDYLAILPDNTIYVSW